MYLLKDVAGWIWPVTLNFSSPDLEETNIWAHNNLHGVSPKQRKLNGVYKSHLEEIVHACQFPHSEKWGSWVPHYHTSQELPPASILLPHPGADYCASPGLIHQLICTAHWGTVLLLIHQRDLHKSGRVAPGLRYFPLYFFVPWPQLKTHFIFLIHSLWWSSLLPKVTTETRINFKIW